MEQTSQEPSLDMQKSIESFYKSFFYVGWRPTLFWVIVIASIHSFLIRPIASTIMVVFYDKTIPPVDNATIVSLVTLVIGGTAIRGIEKYMKGVQ